MANANLYHVTKFPYTCRLLFFISTQKYVVPRNFLSIRIFWAVFICSFSILRNSQLQSDVCRLPYTWSLNSLITQSKLKRRQILCLNAKLQLPKFIRYMYSRKADFRQKFRLPPSSLTFPFFPSHFFNFSFPVSFLSFAGHFRGFVLAGNVFGKTQWIVKLFWMKYRRVVRQDFH